MTEPLVLSADPPAGTRLLVTGGANGIGRAVADAYAARGGKICILDRVPVPDAPQGWICLEGSVANAADVERAFVEMDRTWGGVDVAFANAGISQNKPTLELTEAEWRSVLDVNLTGVFLTVQAAGRRMVAQGAGLILATSSIYGLTAAPNRIAYTATKGAVSQIVRTLASEWGPSGVRVNGIAPGYVRTAMADRLIQQGKLDQTALMARTTLRRFGLPADIAGMACFLGSPAAAWINGAIMSVDGGWMANGGP
ncbi:SDR family NAD(P)-dependent oxidoreductase [Rhodopila sp.]|uniref:SDR family NAD(P)-dependent oxidoreductase n=1 Tax=Rhodopila sp. TaxID=2480087 RepID=UPI002D17224C|nr:SDR family oxidoreductase [Rhodopila sp.]HVZ09561.1 SDR family oxidoreductase [Rhodopila sp.]